jgi:hypothetical protein
MKNVKRIFFLNEEEVKKLKGKDKFIVDSAVQYPCFELEDGTILYPHYGFPAHGECWYAPLDKK